MDSFLPGLGNAKLSRSCLKYLIKYRIAITAKNAVIMENPIAAIVAQIFFEMKIKYLNFTKSQIFGHLNLALLIRPVLFCKMRQSYKRNFDEKELIKS